MRVQDLFSLEGRRALVTGASRGIGRHIALGLAEAGADVVVTARSAEGCDATVAAIVEAGGTASAITADLEQADEALRVAREALAAGPLHVLVNNAARVWSAPSLEYPIEGWDRVFALNVRSLWVLTQQVGRHMAERGGGSIVNVGSISAWIGDSDEKQPVVAYNASKGAVISLTRDLAVKWAPRGIRVNCIAPGPFDTDMMNHIRHDPEALAAYHATIPLARSGGEDDMKGVVTFLASDASAFVTGHTLVVDGGASCL